MKAALSFLNFQYPTLGSNHRYAGEPRRRHTHNNDFQYPTLGSNHRYDCTAGNCNHLVESFSILPSDRTIATTTALLQSVTHYSTFSILPSDRTIATNPLPAIGGAPRAIFQYPTLGSNHRYPGLIWPHPRQLGMTFSILPSDRTIATLASLLRPRHP